MDLGIAGEYNKYYQILLLMVYCELVNIAYSFFSGFFENAGFCPTFPQSLGTAHACKPRWSLDNSSLVREQRISSFSFGKYTN